MTLANSVKNRLLISDEPLHGWYRFVLGYPPHLVREDLKKFNLDQDVDWIFDPFSGTATTPVEARLQGFNTTGTDANPISILANHVKLNWEINLELAEEKLNEIICLASTYLEQEGLSALPEGELQPSLFSHEMLREEKSKYFNSSNTSIPKLNSDALKIIPKDFISSKPLSRVLAVRKSIEGVTQEHKELENFFKLALATVIVSNAGNIAFGPEVYKAKVKDDANVLTAFYELATTMIGDLHALGSSLQQPYREAKVFQEDARKLSFLENHPKIGAVITSPPYPNEKDYTRSTRLESVLLGLINNRTDLRKLKNHLLRSNTRNVFVSDDDDKYINDIPTIINLANQIEKKRIALGKTSGFEKLYHRVVSLYFGGMYRHFKVLLPSMRKGGYCAYVVGDQMSFFRVHIKTANLLADVATKAGFKVEGIELWRTRRSTVTKVDLEENVLILKRQN